MIEEKDNTVVKEEQSQENEWNNVIQGTHKTTKFNLYFFVPVGLLFFLHMEDFKLLSAYQFVFYAIFLVFYIYTNQKKLTSILGILMGILFMYPTLHNLIQFSFKFDTYLVDFIIGVLFCVKFGYDLYKGTRSA